MAKNERDKRKLLEGDVFLGLLNGDFDDDKPTLLALLGRLTGIQVPPKTLTMRTSSEVTRERRLLIDGMATGV